MHPGRAIPVIETDLKEKIQPPAKLQASAVEPLQTLAKLFPLEIVPKASTDLMFAKLKQIAAAAATKSLASGAVVVDEDPSSTANRNADDHTTTLTTVGTVTPDEDFVELLRRGERFSTVCDQMRDVIEALVLKTAQLNREKVGRAMMLFREEAKRLGPHQYNDFVEKLKTLLESRQRTDFWQDVVVGERFGLISSVESEQSAVTELQAEEFYKMGGGTVGPKLEDDGDVSGLLEDMGC